MATDPRRTLILNLRKTVHVRRRFTSEHVAGATIRYTCRTCGAVTEEVLRGGKGPQARPVDEAWAKKMVAYWNSSNGCTGECKACLKRARDTRYPLPSEKTS